MRSWGLHKAATAFSLSSMKNNKILITSLTVLVIAAGATSSYFALDYFSKRNIATETEVVVTEDVPALPVEQRYPFVMPSKSSLSVELSKHSLDHREIHAIVEAAKPFRNLARISSGTRYQVFKTQEPESIVDGIRFRFSPVEILMISKKDGQWVAEEITKPIETRIVTYTGVVRTSLWDSAVEARMNPSLIAELAEIFAWQVDFAREVQVNDRWRLSVEQELVSGEVVGLGTILSAEYVNVENTHTAILFKKDDQKLGYFTPDGSSLRRMFLKSPIQYGRISSRFQKARFHPILNTNRPHLGVDYAAPTGTPIRAVGDGVITLAGWSGGGGNVIKLRHNSTYETAYKHLSRFGKGIKNGTRVTQGQVIGYVGTTGLSTGPHLHFEFFVNGRFVDPLGQKFPTAAPIPTHNLAEFMESQKLLLAHLPEWPDRGAL